MDAIFRRYRKDIGYWETVVKTQTGEILYLYNCQIGDVKISLMCVKRKKIRNGYN
jgi:hypothetical protein